MRKVVITVATLGATALSAKGNHREIVDFINGGFSGNWEDWIQPSASSLLFFLDMQSGAELTGRLVETFEPASRSKHIILPRGEPVLEAEQMEFVFHVPERRKLVSIPFKPTIHIPPSPGIIVSQPLPNAAEREQARFERAALSAARHHPILYASMV